MSDKKKYLFLEKVSKELYRVFFEENGPFLGEFIMDVDGYFYFFPNLSNGGSWSGYILEELAEKLEDLNKEWDKTIDEYFKLEETRLFKVDTGNVFGINNL